ncbi:MAG: glycosyltransferase family 1 protein [Patescibacteria group bacterium]
MNIAIDLRALAGDRVSGVKIYLQNLLAALFRVDKKNHYFLWFNSAREPFPKSLLVPNSPRFKIIQTKFSNRFLNLNLGWREKPKLDLLLAELAGRPIELFWLPDPRPVALSASCKLIATMHDLSPSRFPRFFSAKTRLWHKFLNPEKIAQKADRILAVSDFTKSELENFWHIAPEKISTTPLAAKLSSQKSLPKNLPKRFILALSTLEPRKNLTTLVSAFAELQKEHPGKIELLIAGQSDPKIFANSGIRKHEARSTKQIRFLGRVSEQEKAALLAAAEVFCFPSLYEGFGLPPLEAAAAGTPILAADLPPLRETLGNAAQFLPPQNRDAWRIALAKILADSELRKKMGRAGKIQAQRFTWEKTARATLAAFEMLK